MRILFAYNRPRQEIWEARKNGLVADEHLYGLDHFLRAKLNVEFTDDIFEDSRENFIYRALMAIHSRQGRFVGFAFNRARKLARLAGNYDLIVAWGDSTALPLLLLKRLGRLEKPVIYSSVGLAWLLMNRRWLDPFYRLLVDEACAIVHYGWAEGEILKNRLNVSSSKVKFVPFCVDTDFFTDLARRGILRDGNIIALGRDRLRDWQTLFKAVSGLKVKVKLICPKDAIKNLNVPEEIEWMPEVPLWKLKELLSSAKAVILPVRENPYTAATITALEAMASGRAVVVSKTKAIERGYDFESNRELIFVKPADVGELRDSIKMVASDFELCKRLGTNARASVEEKYNMQVWVDSWLKIFETFNERRA